MQHQSLISVIIPCYNGSRWLEVAMNSVLNQSHRGLEVIVFNDGSTDESADILKRLSSGDARIKVLTSSENVGIVRGLNVMLEVAQGQYIARMDVDDISLPFRFSKQMQYLEEKGLDLCGSWFVEIGQGVARTIRWAHESEAVHAALLFQNPILHPTILAKRKVYEEFSYQSSYELAEDYDLLCRAGSQYRLGNLPEVVFRYRRHAGQATQAKKERMEAVTRSIRISALKSLGVQPSAEEERLHNMVRAPVSISSIEDLLGIETWLLKLYSYHDSDVARKLIASQWIRACIRAAPLRNKMWRYFIKSPLRKHAQISMGGCSDIFLLSCLGLEYSGKAYQFLRRFGLSG